MNVSKHHKENVIRYMKMFDEYILKIVDHNTGDVLGSDKGTARYVSIIIQETLENLSDEEGVIINKIVNDE